ncbi:hypothetical protein BCR34DRAFT_651182 [Clohesyomyces aquaticus]|uniref:Uncharacterized protein n=1 Tax=Clohesyomyces aquaticus TaxID=1231657 RepID=A0A1Y1ZR03_9PLEO|nr:hypothetical protein BCR34DRAFT_651182 [Clohesyomyces aquaticus]
MIGDWDQLFRRAIALLMFDHLTKFLKITKLSTQSETDTTVMSTYRGGERYMRIPFQTPARVVRKDVTIVTVKCTSEKAKLLATTLVRLILTRLKINYQIARYKGIFCNGTVMSDIIDDAGARAYTPLSADEMRNPREEDMFLTQRLMVHLNQNLGSIPAFCGMLLTRNAGTCFSMGSTSRLTTSTRRKAWLVF